MAHRTNRPASELYEKYEPGCLDDMEPSELFHFDAAHMAWTIGKEKEAAKAAQGKGSAASRYDQTAAQSGNDLMRAYQERAET